MTTCRRSARTSRLIALCMAITWALTATPVVADDTVGANIPVLVVAEDQDPATVIRSSDIHRRVVAELKGALQRHGFRVIDEESVAVDLGWIMLDRRSKTELLQAIKLMARSHDASHQVRAWVLYRIHVQATQLRFSTRIRIRIAGEIHDAASNQFLDGFEMPRHDYPAPVTCLQQPPCLIEAVGDQAREIAASLGAIVAVKLQRYAPPGRPGHGLLTPYTLVLRHFASHEARAIVGVMGEEFPGYQSHDLITTSAAISRYRYVTTAQAVKLEEWLSKLLADRGFRLGREVLIQVQDTRITVDKLVPTASWSPPSEQPTGVSATKPARAAPLAATARTTGGDQ